MDSPALRSPQSPPVGRATISSLGQGSRSLTGLASFRSPSHRPISSLHCQVSPRTPHTQPESLPKREPSAGLPRSASCSFPGGRISPFIDTYYLPHESLSALCAVYFVKTEAISAMRTLLCHNRVVGTGNKLKEFFQIKESLKDYFFIMPTLAPSS